MITARLRLPGMPEVVLEIPEREGWLDALDLLDATIARIEGRDWQAVLRAIRGPEGVERPTDSPKAPPSPASAALALLSGEEA